MLAFRMQHQIRWRYWHKEVTTNEVRKLKYTTPVPGYPKTIFIQFVYDFNFFLVPLTPVASSRRFVGNFTLCLLGTPTVLRVVVE